MSTNVETAEILQVLNGLPPEKIIEVKDFVNFLHAQYQRSQNIDESSDWSDEDLREFTASSRFAEESLK